MACGTFKQAAIALGCFDKVVAFLIACTHPLQHTSARAVDVARQAVGLAHHKRRLRNPPVVKDVCPPAEAISPAQDPDVIATMC
jgi:hypothetical protein